MLTRRRLLAGTAALLATPALASTPDKQRFSQSAFDAALRAGRPVLVEITAPWCSVCRAQRPILSELTRQARFQTLAVFEIDFDSQKDAVRALRAQSQSTLIVFKGGQEVGRSVGDTNRASIESLLARAI